MIFKGKLFTKKFNYSNLYNFLFNQSKILTILKPINDPTK